MNQTLQLLLCLFVGLVVMLLGSASYGESTTSASDKAVTSDQAPSLPALMFANTEFFHRFSGPHQFEFTPEGQEDLSQWKTMLTINRYPDVKDGDGLAQVANAVLSNYQSAKGQILRTNSVPRTPSKPAEHFAAAVLGAPSILELVFIRLRLFDDTGYAVVNSYRFYGEDREKRLSDFAQKYGSTMETLLMSDDVTQTVAKMLPSLPR